jgi:hypothetical protein
MTPIQRKARAKKLLDERDVARELLRASRAIAIRQMLGARMQKGELEYVERFYAAINAYEVLAARTTSEASEKGDAIQEECCEAIESARAAGAIAEHARCVELLRSNKAPLTIGPNKASDWLAVRGPGAK